MNSKRIAIVVTLVALIGALIPALAGGNYNKAQKDIVDTAVEAGEFTTLVTAVQAALADGSLVARVKAMAPDQPFYRQMKLALAHYRQQAVASAARWLGRLALIAILVFIGWDVDGAILGNIGGVLLAAALGEAGPLRQDDPIAWAQDPVPEDFPTADAIRLRANSAATKSPLIKIRMAMMISAMTKPMNRISITTSNTMLRMM